MRHVLLGLILMLSLNSTAHAMGADVGYRLVAWNKTGTSVLLERTSNADGDIFRSYVVLSTTGSSQSNEEVSGTVSWNGHGDDGLLHEQLTREECELTAAALAIELREQHFNSVVIRAERCANPRRDIVRAPEAKQPTKARTKVQRAAEQLVIPDYDESAAATPCPDTMNQLAVASRTGKLVLVFETNQCDSPTRTSVHAVIPQDGVYALGETAM